MTTFKVEYKSPIGVIEIIGTEQAVQSILFIEKESSAEWGQAETPTSLIDCYNQLDEYFRGIRQEFTFPYELKGTDFQREVWNTLTEIPYAKTQSYKELAVTIGNEKAIRAVGSANGKNKLSIVIPCHRVIGSNGTLTGYAGGLWRKKWLLEHEKSMEAKKMGSGRK
ncbi:methylated-DNA--[protein]-cysteine S-methyltransferase [Ureibacillus sp. FSL E2-3493]|uniref:methylated-DNA--[protein]-cysteine S-methyltransferase n=1 Tax=Ureibacillus sp. FSL E2-3493 TaxID=2921367 RepID=UPI0031196CC1